ncbi:hypothetical protein A2U01_0104040, partial [Trifolium medium]|nr:hypothetical protein [Trifolium medium]
MQTPATSILVWPVERG